MQNKDQFFYWMKERERVRVRKERGDPKPWSEDPVFQQTYFCNVNREYDRVTKFIRKMYSSQVNHPLFTPNIILSRFLNWPDTLQYIGYQYHWEPENVKAGLNELKQHGKVWGNAYVVTTHGIPMDKIDYLCDRVMPSALQAVELDFNTCLQAAAGLMFVEGISTFMAGQVIADLKNTPGHSLQTASDWKTFVLPGPGSKRGMDWLYGKKLSEREWYMSMADLLCAATFEGWSLCAQNLQNCLCEFDKYMRVKNGTGRSKRNYNGLPD